MRFLAAVTIFIAFAPFAPAEGPCQVKTTLDFGLHGSVRWVEEPASRLEFDDRGRALKLAYASNGKYQVFRYLYSPNSLDYEIQVFETSSPGGGQKPADLQRHTAKFDALGRCIEEQDLGSDGSSNGLITYEYFGQTVIREESYDSNGQLFSIEDHEYNSGHHLVQENSKQFGPHADEGIRKYVYNKLGQQTDVLSYRQGKLDVHYVSTFDAEGRVTSCEVLTAETPLTNSELHPGTTRYEYDSHGNVVQETDYDGLTRNSSYSYDSQGNWIKQVTSDGYRHVSVTKRAISYRR